MTWVARNTGLSGDALNQHWIVQNPATRQLSSESHELWLATDDGIYHSLNGGRQWSKIALPTPSNDELLLSSPATIDDLKFHWIDYDPTNQTILYALGAAILVGKNRLWIYKTTDVGLIWTSRGVTTL